jgi:multisubunit Na+/H+ antiporter MnhF subunit
MSEFLLAVTVFVALLIVLALHRIQQGPTVYDRVVAAALMTANGMVLLLLIGFLFDRFEFFVDITIGYALLAFVLPLALSKYFEGKGKP